MTPKEKMQYIKGQIPDLDMDLIRQGYRTRATSRSIFEGIEDEIKWKEKIDNMSIENKKTALKILYQENMI